MSNVPNPWEADAWNLTEQGAYIKKYGVEVAKRKARQAGSALGALPPRTLRPVHVTIVQQRTINNITEGSRGYSGDAPPDENVV